MTYDRNIRAYRETDVQSMGKEKLIVLLYQKILEHLDVAARAANQDRVEMSRRLGLAQRIITELRAALDHSIGGEIADNLSAIYSYSFQEILAMQVDQDPSHAENCRRTLEPLLEAWQQIPPGSADRELGVASQQGTDPATSRPDNVSDGSPGKQMISLSA